MDRRHNVFISYHHANDSNAKFLFERLFHELAQALISRSVDPGDIDPNNKTDTIRRIIRDRFISTTSVTVVLIGAETHKRKHVDWEIGYSLTQTAQNQRNGLLGIRLPTGIYAPLPPRLEDNVASGYATVHPWPQGALEVQNWVHAAFLRRGSGKHVNSRDYFVNNR